MSAVFEFPTESYRLMTEYDLPDILDIEQRSYDFPWTEGIFHDCLRFGYSSWVIEVERKIISLSLKSFGY